jgi:hypothetical protein
MKNALVIITAAFLFCATLMAQDAESNRKTLKGLIGVQVLVENLNPDVIKDGLSGDQIQTDVELRLRIAGIKVLTQADSISSPGMPVLYIRVHAIKSGETYSCSEEVRLGQNVKLDRDPQIILPATTWGTGGLGIIGVNKLDVIRDRVKDDVDKFINAWLSVNPKN